MKKHIYLEAIRGGAALIVVFTHYFAAFYPATVYGNAYPAHAPWESLFIDTPLGLLLAAHFAVALFFVLSGYVLSIQLFGPDRKDNLTLLAALVKRPFRLAGLVIFTELASFCLLRTHGFFHIEASELTRSIPWFRESLSAELPGFGRLLSDILTQPFAAGARYNPPLWTIQIELYGSFLTFGFVFFFRQCRFRLLAYVIATLVCRHYAYQGFIFGIMFADFSRNFPALLGQCTRPWLAWPMLIVGLLLAPYPNPEYIAHAAMTNPLYRLLPPLPFLGWGYPLLGATLVFFSALLNPALQRFLSTPGFAFLGRISFAIYAVHFVVLASASSWLFLKLLPTLGYHVTFAVVFTGSLAGLLCLSHLLSKYVDQPAIDFANFVSRKCQATLKPKPPAS